MNGVLRQMLDHRFTKAHASDYLDGALPHEDRHRLERHTSVCPRCRELLASVRRMLEALQALRHGGRADIADGVVQRLRHDA